MKNMLRHRPLPKWKDRVNGVVLQKVMDILTVNYAELGAEPAARIKTLVALGRLLNRSTGRYRREDLASDETTWNALRGWLAAGNGVQFWRLDADGIRVLRPCDAHLLLGTSLLISDIDEGSLKPVDVTFQHHSSTPIDAMWSAARQYITQL
jgi:hypothetical protein